MSYGLKAKTAREYREKHGMVMPTKKLARIMHAENKPLFTDAEDARSNLRRIEGKDGKYSITAKTKITHPYPERPRNPYNLPDSDETEYTPFILSGHKRIAVFSDIHIPYHSIAALTAALSFCKKEKPDALLLNGDTLDCFQLSKFVKDPRKRHFAEELKIFQETIKVFSSTLKCKIYFKYGNHEERYENFLFQKAKELVGVEEFELENIIKARVGGIEIIKDKRIIRASGLNIIHGHEFSTGFFSPVNVARGLFLRGKTSALQGHSHQTSEHTESDMNGKITTTWSTGCLSELHPQYAPLNKWNWGFCLVDLDNTGFDVRNKRIYKGEVL
jgi:predicted phosphodiesterase